ncbi:MAG TPA: carboxynorspermidine decarboxylase [Clostridiales bacterium]|mgnify:CR=1 FL=1|jgi:carboxynorspermidine decarboxylase|nr:carboxynorspermidine decarboxylase [Clostridiales bacterium]HBE13624.1 carboxynorspermidine decarboxylase [Clostridiales bacterium]HCG35452.1 carboxynorspermidine decarboxylase [Clostridiales bacterium]
MNTPYYVVDEACLIRNLELLQSVAKRAGCKILLAQKAFSMFSLYPLIGRYIHGTAASGLFEAKLGKEEMGGETHVFSTAYKEEEMEEILSLCDHIVFNSFSQWERYKDRAIPAGKACGIRLNPRCSTQKNGLYDPCQEGSRLGVTKDQFREDLLEGISGFHVHTLCEQNSDDLVTTLKAVEEQFGEYIHGMEWFNFGGGHHITRKDYDVDTLVDTILAFKEKYGVNVYLEPGEAVALHAGYLVSSVLDIVYNDLYIAILDTSAACHMPDVLEMPYRPNIMGGALPKIKAHTYRLAGPTCLSGDIIGDYSLDAPLQIGDKVVFCDMAIYTMVKNNTFNGMKLPSIAWADTEGKVTLIKKFGYLDFKNRLS